MLSLWGSYGEMETSKVPQKQTMSWSERVIQFIINNFILLKFRVHLLLHLILFEDMNLLWGLCGLKTKTRVLPTIGAVLKEAYGA